MAAINCFPSIGTYGAVVTNQMSDLAGSYNINPTDTSNLSATLNGIFTSGSKTVRLGAGNFTLKSTVNILFNGITIIGSGTGATTLTIDETSMAGSDGFLVDKVYGTVIRDLTLTASSGRTSGNGIHIRGGDITNKLDASSNLADSNFRIENVDMTKQFTGIYVNNDTNNYNWRGYIRGGRHSQISASGHGVWIDAGTSASAVGASHFISDFWVGQTPATTNAAIRLTGSGDATITNTEAYGCTYGILMDTAASGFLTSITVNGGFIDRSGTACMSIQPNASVSKFGELRFNGVWFAGSTNGNCVDIAGAAANLILFNNCTLYSAEGSPGWCAKVNASTNVQFVGGSIAGATTGGLLFTGSASHFKVRDVTFTGTGIGTGPRTTLPTGIQVDAGCDHYSVEGNDLSDAAVGGTAKITNTPGTAANQRIVQDNVTA